MISAVIFDCDGVLVDSEIIAHRIEIEVLAELGLDYEPDAFKARFMGMSDKALRAALELDAQARLGRSILDDLKILHARYWQALEAELLPVAGVHDAIDAVRGLKAVASSSTERGLERKLRKTGLWSRFAPHIYSAEHVTHAKPAPDLFLLAARELGVAAENCLVIEDSVNGVLAAQAAGMTVWGFMGGAHMDANARTLLVATDVARIVDNWAEAAPLLRGL
ncbi:MAG: haloacid dehalogenase [Gammaproteobacteria bacterium]|nr:haloacid dehalogenase [Gammaproteobacteria bacterium]